jgi:hypothetical protein
MLRSCQVTGSGLAVPGLRVADGRSAANYGYLRKLHDRTYNSLDPRSSGAFGAGWSSVADTSLRNNGPTVTVTLPDGQQMTFGENGNGTYAAPMGSPDVLVESSSGTWTLRDASDIKPKCGSPSGKA